MLSFVFVVPLLAFQEPTDLRATIEKIVSIQYPRLPSLALIQGEVAVKFKISANGEAQILQVKGDHPFLDKAAVEGLSRWRFQKAQVSEGEAGQATHTLKFTFNLKGVCLNSSCATIFEFEFPNHVRIETSPPHWQPDTGGQISTKPKPRERKQAFPWQNLRLNVKSFNDSLD